MGVGGVSPVESAPALCNDHSDTAGPRHKSS